MKTVQSLHGFDQNFSRQQNECDALICVLVIEKCKLIRSAIHRMIKEVPGVGSIIETDSFAKTPKLLETISPSVLFINLTPSTSLKECLKIMKLVKEQYPQIGMIALMAHVVPEAVYLLSKGGINGLLDDAATEQDLESAVRASAIGNIFHSRRIYEQIILPDKISLLTISEMHVLTLVMQGNTNYLIAQKMNITTKTVEAHLTRIYKKLDVTSRVQAIIRAQELHLSLDNLSST